MIDVLRFLMVTRALRDGSISMNLEIMNNAYPRSSGSKYRAMFTTGIRILPEQFITANAGSRFGPWIAGDDETTHTRNLMIREVIQKMDEIYTTVKYKTKREPFASEIIDVFKNGYKVKLRKKLLEFIPEYVTANSLTESTANIYTYVLAGALRRYLTNVYHAEDIYLDEIDTVFMYRFDMFMGSSLTRHGKPYAPGTITEILNKLVAVVGFAFKTGEVDKDVLVTYNRLSNKNTKDENIVKNFRDAVTWKMDPVDLHKIETVVPAGKALNEELEDVKNQNGYNLARTRLCFLLQTWTGFAYADLVNNRNVREVIRKDMTGADSIIYHRAKNGELALVPLFPQAKAILEALEYNPHPNCSYDTYLRKIKALFRYYNIEMDDKEGTHVGRHLFGSRMLNMGFSMEAISRMMGHTSIRETEKVYARVDLTKINLDYDRIKLTTQELGNRIAV
jgi:hypothetical protein